MNLKNLEEEFFIELEKVNFDNKLLSDELKSKLQLQIKLQKEIKTLENTNLVHHLDYKIKNLIKVDQELYSNSEYRLYLNSKVMAEQVIGYIDTKISELKE